MIQSILIIFTELLNINKAHVKNIDEILSTLKFLHKMSADTVLRNLFLALKNWSIRCGGCTFIDFYNGSGITILKTYTPTTSASYGPVQQCYKRIL